MARLWTDENINQLKTLIEIHQSNIEVASIMDMSIVQIEKAMQTYHLKRSNPSTRTERKIEFVEVPCQYPELGFCHEIISHSSKADHRARITSGGKTVTVYRRVWEQTHGPIPDGLYVLHSCDNDRCINLDHLRLGTHLENIQDAVDRDRVAKGEMLATKLTEEEVREIRERAVSGERQADLAEEFGISEANVSFIKNKKRWAWLE